jgi:hypothetical protein
VDIGQSFAVLEGLGHKGRALTVPLATQKVVCGLNLLALNCYWPWITVSFFCTAIFLSFLLCALFPYSVLPLMAVVVVGREGIRGASLFGSGKLAGVKTHAEMSEDIAREFSL